MSDGYAGALVILTRPQGRNEWLGQQLAALGLPALSMPVLGIEPASVSPASLPRPRDYDLVVFVSGNAVTAYFQQLEQMRTGPVQWPAHGLVGAVGSATASAIAQTQRVPADQVLHPDHADEQDSEALWKLLEPRLAEIRTALLVRGQDGREWLGRRLEQAQIQVTRHAAYHRRSLTWTPQDAQRLRDAMAVRRTVICLLTSAHGVQAFVDNAAFHGLLPYCAEFHYVVIHPRIAGRLQSTLESASGMVVDLAVSVCPPTDHAMLQAVKSLASL